jgi:hypothetical protein
MKFDRNEVDGKVTYFVFGIDDINTASGCICRYRQGELQEAIEHADTSDGIVVSADWTGFIAVEHVASTIRPEDIANRAIEGKPSEEALWAAEKALSFIWARTEERSLRRQQVADIMQDVADNAIAYRRFQVTDHSGRPFSIISDRELTHAVVPSCHDGSISWHDNLATAENMAARYASHGDDLVYVVPLAKKAKAQLFKLAA